jgi:hypothetical protein
MQQSQFYQRWLSRDANPFAQEGTMEARLFIEVESIKEIEYCYQSLSNEYKFIFVFCISDHQDVFHYCMQHRLPICPSTHVLSDQQLVKRYKHNIFFNLCEEYIPHIMLSYTIVKVDNIEEIIYLSKRSFHSYLWLGSDDDIPRIKNDLISLLLEQLILHQIK